MPRPCLLYRESVFGWAELPVSPSAGQYAPLDPDKTRFPSKSPDALCLDRASTEHPPSLVCRPWSTFRSKPFLVQPTDSLNGGFCTTCSSGPVHFLGIVQNVRRWLGRVIRVQKLGASELLTFFAKVQRCMYRSWAHRAAPEISGPLNRTSFPSPKACSAKLWAAPICVTSPHTA